MARPQPKGGIPDDGPDGGRALVPVTTAPEKPGALGAPASSDGAEVGAQSAALSPIVVIALAFLLGFVLARWLDWMDRARAGL